MGLKAISKYNRGSNGKSPIEEIILLVQLGDERDKDRPPAVHYITLTCNFTFSCFGMPLKVLTSTALREKAISDFSFPADYDTINTLGNEFAKIYLLRLNVKNI